MTLLKQKKKKGPTSGFGLQMFPEGLNLPLNGAPMFYEPIFK